MAERRSLQLPAGRITVAPRAIARIAAHAAGRSEALIGLTSSAIGAGASRILRDEEAYRGVEVRIRNGEISVELYVVLRYGAPIAEAARALQERVRAAIERALGTQGAHVQIRVQGLQTHDAL